MKHWQKWTGSRLLSLSLLLTMAVVLAACASKTSFAPVRLIPPDQLTGVQTKTARNVTVKVAILTDEQARKHFGVDIGEKGLQALWMRVRNGRNGRLWFIQNTLDPDLYTADEAALMMQDHLPKDQFKILHQHFRDESIRLAMEAHTITEGFVFLPRVEGGRYVDIRLTGDAFQVEEAKLAESAATGEPSDIEIWELRFGFALPLPDGDFDYERLDTDHTYAGMDLPDLGLEDLRIALEQLPCCATDKAGENNADPLNVVIVGESADLLNTLTRSGWSFTHRISMKTVGRTIGSAISHEAYPIAPVSSLYVFDRKQDFALQRARDSISQRNHMRFWMAPFTYQGRQVWVGQISRDIGIKLSTKSPSLTTHVIDPEMDLAREYLLHSLLAEGFVHQFGFVRGSVTAPRAEPASNLTDDPYFSDGMRLVIMLSPNPLPLVDVRNLRWEQSSAPVAGAQSEEAVRYVRPIEDDTGQTVTTGPAPAAAEAKAPARAQQNTTEAVGGLGGTRWRLLQIMSMNDNTYRPDNPSMYTLNFGADGSMTVLADCNRGNGSWNSETEGQLQFGPIAATRAMCPPGSLHDRYLSQFEWVRSYVMRDGHLFLATMADGAIIEFEPADED